MTYLLAAVVVIVYLIVFYLIRKLIKALESESAENVNLSEQLSKSNALNEQLTKTIKEITVTELSQFSKKKMTLDLLSRSFNLINEIYASTTDAATKEKILMFSGSLPPKVKTPAAAAEPQVDAKIYKFPTNNS